MSRTIEAIMRHMTLPSNRTTNQQNGTEKLEKEFTVRKRHYVWSESRFVRAMMPFHSNVRVGYNGKEVDGKSVLDLMTLAPPEGKIVKVRAEGPDALAAIQTVEQLVRSRIYED
jgi:phosphocarrier protein HPr